MSARIHELLHRNLQEVFGEGEAACRRAAVMEDSSLVARLTDLIDGVEIAMHERAGGAPTCRYDWSFHG